jgi:hypothetical protein
MTEPNVSIMFQWKSTMPDVRQYKQNSTILEPVAQMVGIDVPLTSEYVRNSEHIITAQLSAGAIENPVLTTKGMRYCIDQLEDVFDGSDLLPQCETDEDWDESLPKTKESDFRCKSDDEPWDEIDFTAPEDKKEEAWKDTEEDWNG